MREEGRLSPTISPTIRQMGLEVAVFQVRAASGRGTIAMRLLREA